MNIISRVTLKGLYKNKVRTIVTIIGVILSAAMFTAVTTLISSTQNYLVNLTIAEDGNWYAAVHGTDYNDYKALGDEEEIDAMGLTRGMGYSVLEESTNKYKPYLYVMGLDDGAFDVLPVNLSSGRLPQNENEVIISETIATNAGVSYQVGDTLELELGRRELDDGTVLDQNDGLISSDDGHEKLVYESTRKFTIVGVMKRLSYKLESYNAPGYTVITMLNDGTAADAKDLSIYFRTRNPKNIYKFIDSLTESRFSIDQVSYNSALLRMMGISDHEHFLAVLYGLSAVLIGLIMVGSISLIYNSFSISVSERKKQFGMLSSIGATSRQLKRSVLFEALFIAGIGVPLGILSGVLGIGVTLYYVSGLLSSLIATGVQVPLTLSVSKASVAVAAVVSLCTILISAYIPARAIGKVSAMDAIRQTKDIKLAFRQVRTWKLWRKLFGMEGDLALKNMRRNRRRYRSTVFSLCISVILFISASAYSMYLKEGVENVYEDKKYDLSYYAGNNASDDKASKAYKSIVELDSVDKGAIVWNYPYGIMKLSSEQLDESYYQEVKDIIYSQDGNTLDMNLIIYVVDHATFGEYIKNLGLDKSKFENSQEPAGIIVDNQHYYDYQQKRFRNLKAFRSHNPQRLTIELGEYKKTELSIDIASFADVAPFGISDYSPMNNVMLIFDEGMMDKLSVNEEDMWEFQYMFFASEDPFKTESEIKDILISNGLDTSYLSNTAQAMQSTRNLITIISVFAYGFIILISLITIANVFNTISTNVNLRRREFAMLKSVGMTDKSFNRMLNFECMFYGFKALLYGLPASIGVTYLIYSSLNEGVDMSFHLPAQGMLISVFSVFIVVFVSMMYSLNKIRKENILDALRNENL